MSPYKRNIGSVILVKNVTKGINISGCYFDSNIGIGGTNLLIEGFFNTASYPIILQNNVFQNNFAYHFAPTLAILNYYPDLV
jgi:hypothetical protein